MKIVISSALDGLDRTTRILRLLERFKGSSHELFFAGSGRAFGIVDEALEHTFSITYKPAYNPADQDEFNWQNNKFLLERLRYFQPDVMILDGEAFAAQVAQRLHLPIISIDHMHMFQCTRLDITIPPAQMDLLMEQKELLKQRKYRAFRYMLPLFFQPSPTQTNAFLTAPLVRPQLDTATPTQGDAFVAYAWPHIQTDLEWFQTLEQPLQAHVPIRKTRYEREQVMWEKEVEGSDGNLRRRRKEQLPRNLDTEEIAAKLPANSAQVTYKVADPNAWVSELAASKAVLMDGEMTAISEAIALQKPMLLIPHPQRFDQWCYAHIVEKMGFGEFHPKLTRAALEGFLERIERYRENLQTHQSKGPDFFDALEQQLGQIPTRQAPTSPSKSSRSGPPRSGSSGPPRSPRSGPPRSGPPRGNSSRQGGSRPSKPSSERSRSSQTRPRNSFSEKK